MQIIEIIPSIPSNIITPAFTPVSAKVADAQYQKLVSRLNALKKESNTLELKKENLLNTTADLRQMIKTVQNETEEEMKERKERNQRLAEEKKSLQKGLKNQYQNGAFLSKMGSFWKQFVRE